MMNCVYMRTLRLTFFKKKNAIDIQLMFGRVSPQERKTKSLRASVEKQASEQRQTNKAKETMSVNSRREGS